MNTAVQYAVAMGCRIYFCQSQRLQFCGLKWRDGPLAVDTSGRPTANGKPVNGAWTVTIDPDFEPHIQACEKWFNWQSKAERLAFWHHDSETYVCAELGVYSPDSILWHDLVTDELADSEEFQDTVIGLVGGPNFQEIRR